MLMPQNENSAGRVTFMRGAVLMEKKIWVAVGLAALLAGPVLAKDKGQADLSGWFGAWTTGQDQEITIVANVDGSLSVDGAAVFGADDPERVASGAINVGSFAGNIPADWIEDGKVVIASTGEEIIPTSEAGQYDCWVEMALEGETLVVDDNGQCGGLNVSFAGTYERAEQATQ